MAGSEVEGKQESTSWMIRGKGGVDWVQWERVMCWKGKQWKVMESNRLGS